MRKQFLWIRSPGMHYMAPGNVQIGPGDRGSVSFWYHRGNRLPLSNELWRAEADSATYASIGWTAHAQGHLDFRIVSAGTSRSVRVWDVGSLLPGGQWTLITATWDLSQPGAGVMYLYVGGLAETTAVTDASGLAQLPAKIYLGGKYGEPGSGCCMDHLLILDQPMSRDQHNARIGTSSDPLALRNARRRLPRALDLPGNLLLHAAFDGSYDAIVAAGDATAHFDAPAGQTTGHTLLDDGARHKGRKLMLPLGKPRQDHSHDDRIPLEAVLHDYAAHGIGNNTSVVNEDDCARLVIAQAPSATYGEGRGWLWNWLEPGDLDGNYTLRMRLHMPAATNPRKYWTCLGPLLYYSGGMHGGIFGTWGSGAEFTVVADGGNSASQFKTSLGTYAADYWVGAELSVVTGNCAPARLKVAGYDADTKVVTLAGSLQAVPDAGSICVVDFRGRLCPHGYSGQGYRCIEQQSMEAWLWEEWSTDRPWIELECQRGGVPIVRYARGRSQYMEFTHQRANDTAAQGMMFGKLGAIGPHEGYSADIRLECIELNGPGNYQLLPATNSAYGRACAPADCFMVLDPKTGLSTRLWRTENVTWALRSPTKCPNPAQTLGDLNAPGTWRETCQLQALVDPQPSNQQLTVLARGCDAQGVWRLGYLVGSYDPAQRRMTWTEETPPPGKANPFMKLSELHPNPRTDSDWGVEVIPCRVQVFGLDDGTWAMIYNGPEKNPDHYLTYAMHGAADRWTFCHEQHFWPHNPIGPGVGGVDKLPPEYGGVGLWANRDCELEFIRNPYATDSRERFVGYGRGKTILPVSSIGTNVRPLVGLASADLKAFHPLPHGNMISPLPSGSVHVMRAVAYGPDTLGILVEYYGGGLRLYSSEDNLHFQQITRLILGGELPGEPTDIAPGLSFCIGAWRIYYYGGGGFLNLAAIGRNRETRYELSAGKLSGLMETAVVQRPVGGWGELLVNSDPQAGSIAVELVDPSTEQPVAGYSAADCDPVGDDIEAPVSWGGKSLADLNQPYLRLVFHLSRSQAADDGPELFGWEVRRAEAADLRPAASEPTVDGRTNPAGLTNPTPTFGWSYSDPRGLAQSAWHVLVASSRAVLDAGEGDLWDSGPTVGDAPEATYAGAELAEQTTYFWKVRVCNSEGLWSEAW